MPIDDVYTNSFHGATRGTSAAGSVAGGLIGGMLDTGLSLITGRSNARYQSDLAFDNWKKQFDLINAYNHPAKQLQRYASVGVNPFVNPSGSQMVGASSSGATPQMGMPSFSPAGSFGTSFSQLMQGLLSAQSAKGKGIENEKLQDWLSAQIREKLSSANHQEILADMDSFMLELKKEFGRGEEQSKIINQMAQAYNHYANAILAKDYETAVKEAEAYRHIAEGVKAYTESHNNVALHQKIVNELGYQDEQLQAQIDEKRAEAQERRASAYESYERGKSEIEHRQEMKASAEELGTRSEKNLSEKRLNNANAYRLESTRNATIKFAENQAEIERKKNNVFSWKFSLEVAKAVGAGLLAVAGAKKYLRLFSGAKSVKDAADKGGSKGVGDFAAHVKKPGEKGTNLNFNDPKVQQQYPTLYAIWKASQRGGVR